MQQLELDKVSWLHRDIDKEVLRQIAERDPFPLPAVEDRENYYGERHLDYWLSGYNDYAKIREIYNKFSVNKSESINVLDWGCASGRVLRHFAYQMQNVRAFGVDVKHLHCRWIKENLDSRVISLPAIALPHLQFCDSTFDIIYGFSVLTHIGEFDITWIAELLRVVKPNGLIVVTVLSDSAWKKMKPGFIVYDSLVTVKDHFDEPINLNPEYFSLNKLDRCYFSWSALDPVYNCTGFHSHEYIRNHWGKIAEVVDIQPNAHVDQDIVVLRRN